ncbi:MAG: prepilin-type N-terminal cleavage/methylation domain-containing protein [Candidatus Pacebacteria bacterium]|nr:prepilin-type N-terminal cleavage/methylation domain-containing protein [Candidatus Paceibacterota bacterium]
MKNKGFTLIELIVVIAIIGILSTVVIVNVNRVRREARNATIQANLAALRAEAEFIFIDATPDSYELLCVAADNTLNEAIPALARIETAITEQGGAITCVASPTEFCVNVPLVGGVDGFACVDHLGHSGIVATAICGGGVPPVIRCI